jgi:hypothetical protein
MSAAAPRRRLLYAAPLVVPSLLAAALVAYGTHTGIGLSTDSAAYIGAARGLRAGAGVATRGGDGTMQPMTLYAPLLPALIAGVSALGPDPFAAVRGLHVALAAFNTAMVVWLILRDTGSRGWALAGGLVVAPALPFLMPHAIVWSEPTFFACVLVAVACLAHYRTRGSGRALAAAALAVGLGTMARYAGLALLPTGAALVATRRDSRRAAALRDTVLFVLLSSAAPVAWGVRNQLHGALAYTRELGWHPPPLECWRRMAGSLLGWLGLRGIGAAVALAAAGLALGASVTGRPRRSFTALLAASPPAAWVAAVFAVAQIAFLLLAATFADATTTIDPRLLAPAFVCAAVAAIGTLARWSQAASWSPWQRVRLAVAVLVVATAHLGHSIGWLAAAHADGYGFAHRSWRESPLLARVRALPPAVVVYTNGVPAVQLLLDRPADYLPERELPMAGHANPAYEAELARMRRRLAASHGVVIYFSAIDWVRHVPEPEELERRLGLRATYRSAEGTMYELTEPAP